MNWEFSFLYALQELHNPILDAIMTFITRLGDGGYFWIGVGIVCLIMKKHRKMGFDLLLSMLFTFFLGNLILKNIFQRERPCTLDPTIELLISRPSAHSYSFPSGHSMNGMAAAVAIFCNNKKVGIAALVLAVLIGFSRMYHFVHFPTDVLTGFCVGTAMAMLVQYVFGKKMRKSDVSVE